MDASGVITLDGDRMRYRSAACGRWDIDVPQILVLGERTTQDGPFADDYFFCFAIDDGMWYEASFYAEGADRFLEALETRLDAPLRLELQNSADFASRVLWPTSMAGEPMFDWGPAPTRTLLGRVRNLFNITCSYTPQIADFLAARSPRTPAGDPPTLHKVRALRDGAVAFRITEPAALAGAYEIRDPAHGGRAVLRDGVPLGPEAAEALRIALGLWFRSRLTPDALARLRDLDESNGWDSVPKADRWIRPVQDIRTALRRLGGCGEASDGG